MQARGVEFAEPALLLREQAIEDMLHPVAGDAEVQRTVPGRAPGEGLVPDLAPALEAREPRVVIEVPEIRDRVPEEDESHSREILGVPELRREVGLPLLPVINALMGMGGDKIGDGGLR